MVTEEEKKFIHYWEKNRNKEKKVSRQFLIGLPIGLLFAVPIVLNFSAGWYKRANMWAQGHNDDKTGVVLTIAALLIVVFVAIFYRRHKWDLHEQQYRELLQKRNRETANKEENNQNNGAQ